MQPETSDAATDKTLLPPVRTRWQSPAWTSGSFGKGILGPVRSGLLRAFEPLAPVAEDAAAAESPAPEAAAPVAAPDEQPWLDTPGLDEYEESEILLEVSVDDEGEELQILEAASGGELELTEPEPDESPVAGITLLGGLDAESLHTAPAPLSAWDLAGNQDTIREEEARLNRVREEWEALGQALVESLEMPVDRETLTSDWANAPEPESGEAPTAAMLEVEGLEPIGAGLGRDSATAGTESPPYGRALEELAERLETFAAALRREGRYAITRAQLSGDRMETLLAGFAAGWLAARGE